MKRFKINQLNSSIKYHLEEGENVEDYEIQESNFEENVNLVKRKRSNSKLVPNLNWPKFDFNNNKNIKKSKNRFKLKKRHSLSYITNVLPIVEFEVKAEIKEIKKIKNEAVKKLISETKANDEYQIEDIVKENIENEQMNKLLVKTFRRRHSTDVESFKFSKLVYDSSNENENEIIEIGSQFEFNNESFKNNSKWLMSRNKILEKKLKKNTKGWQRFLNCCLEDNQTLTFQLKSLIEKDQLQKSAYFHFTTSQLKNKITENIFIKEYVCFQLFKIESTLGFTFGNGKIIDSNLLTYAKNDVFKLLFPQELGEDMGLSNFSIIKLIWPWTQIQLEDQKFILNPFWIDVISRGDQNNFDVDQKESEKIIFSFKCSCRNNLSNIDSLECNKIKCL